IWDRANVPTCSDIKIDQNIRQLYVDYRLKKNMYNQFLAGKNLKPNILKNANELKSQCSKLFDISCKRERYTNDGTWHCKCTNCIYRDQAFLDDQRSA